MVAIPRVITQFESNTVKSYIANLYHQMTVLAKHANSRTKMHSSRLWMPTAKCMRLAVKFQPVDLVETSFSSQTALVANSIFGVRAKLISRKKCVESNGRAADP